MANRVTVPHGIRLVRPSPVLEPFVRYYGHREARLGDTVVVHPVHARAAPILNFEFGDADAVLYIPCDGKPPVFFASRCIDRDADPPARRTSHPRHGRWFRHPLSARSGEFIAALGGAAAWPFAARAQQADRVRRVAGLFLAGLGDSRFPELWNELAKLGWIEGGNLRIDLRFAAASDLDRIRAHAMELVSLDPDVIVTLNTVTTRAMQQQTRTIPIVFASGGGAEIGGVVRNISRPEGNITGMSVRYVSIAGKWLQLLKEAAPQLARVAMIFNPEATVSWDEGGVLSCADRSSSYTKWRPANLDSLSHCGRTGTRHRCIRGRAEWQPHPFGEPR
jgi:hypothetical protein